MTTELRPCPLCSGNQREAIKGLVQERDSLDKKISAYRVLTRTQEEQLSFHRERAEAYRVAVAAIDSERSANERLTEDCDRLKGDLDHVVELYSAVSKSKNTLLVEGARLEEVIGGLKVESAMLRNLLAVIHRDGGQYEKAMGIEKTCTDAERFVAEMIVALDCVKNVDAMIQQATLAEREACALVCEDELDKWDGKDTWECGVMHCAESIRARS